MKNHNFYANEAAVWVSEDTIDLMSTLSFGGGGDGTV